MRLTDDGTTNNHGINQVVALAASTTYTWSIYIKSSTQQWFRIAPTVTSVIVGSAWFDLINGIVGSQSFTAGTYLAHSITALANGWYRCILTATTLAATGGTTSFALRTASANSSTATHSWTATYYPWGAQLEAGLFATSPITTTTLAGTRAADIVTLATSSVTGFSATAGTLYGEGGPFYAAPGTGSNQPTLVSLNDTTVNERILIRRDDGVNKRANCVIVDGGWHRLP